MTQPRSMTTKVCKACKRTIMVNENGSLYEDVRRHHYHTEASCLTTQLETLRSRIRRLCEDQGPCGETGCTTVATCDLLRALDDSH